MTGCGARRGRPRNRILDRILKYAAKRGVSDAELARALADVDLSRSTLREMWGTVR